MDANELKNIIDSHSDWLCGKDGGKCADLQGANLQGANLRGADLQYAICPEVGEFIGWKKVVGADGEEIVIQVKIPADAKRTSSIIGRKCRAEYVIALGDGVSKHDDWTIYKNGAITRPDSYNDDPRLECTNGIHFFITKKEAEDF